MPTFTIWHGDCLEEMSRIEAGSVDAIICDLPYGTTACPWDVVIPFEPLWKHYKRVIKKNGAVVLFGSQPFSSLLVMSNLAWFKYSWTWVKNSPTGHLNAKRQPMMASEDIPVFYREQPTYNPQLMRSNIRDRTINKSNGKSADYGINTTSPYGTHRKKRSFDGTIWLKEWVAPRNVLEFSVVPKATGTLHPTQKPVALLSYLIKTYTNEGETVLDSTCGSGSTLEAAMRCKRNSIGIEKDAHYFNVAQQRLERVAAELRGELNHLPMFQGAAL